MKKGTFIFYVIGMSLVVFIFKLPCIFASDLSLSSVETHFLLNSIQQTLIEEWIKITSSEDFSEPEKQAVLFIVRNAIQKKELEFAFKEIPLKTLESALKIAGFLLTHREAEAILRQLEKETLKIALKKGTDWLLKNEIRIARGNFNYSFKSYQGKIEKPELCFLVVYHQGEVVIEIYSPEAIEPPKPQGFSVLDVGTSLWDFSLWRKQGKSKIPPFVLTVKGKVEKEPIDFLKFSFLKIEFPENVPFCKKSRFTKIPFFSSWLSEWKKTLAKIEIFAKKLSQKISSLKEKIIYFFRFEGAKISKIEFQNKRIFKKKPKFEIQKTKTQEKQFFEKTSQKEPKFSKNPPLKSQINFSQFQAKLSLAKENLEQILAKIETLNEKKEKSSKNLIKEIEKNEIQKEQKTSLNFQKTPPKENSPSQDSFPELCQKKDRYPKRDKVIINEIAWAGSRKSPYDEWIELKNITFEDIDISGWHLQDKDNQIKIVFPEGTVIKAHKFLLLERTNDDSVPEIPADLIYTGTLNNSNEALFLFDENCRLEDEVFANPDWPAGDNNLKKSMERGENFDWHTFAGFVFPGIQGTPRQENTKPLKPLTQGGEKMPQIQENVPENSKNATSSQKFSFCQKLPSLKPSFSPVIFNEIAWMGTKNSFYDEWIELKNVTDKNVSLAGWQILNEKGKIKIIFEEKDVIPPHGFYLLERTDENSVPYLKADRIYKGALGDQEESLWLFDQNCNLIDKILAFPSWPGGDKKERRSMERTQNLEWQTFQGEGKEGVLGTPKAKNSSNEFSQDTTPPKLHFTIALNQKSQVAILNWSGQDKESGIKNYDIEYQKEGEGWQKWLEKTTSTRAVFEGESGFTYYFRARARDKAGNLSDWSIVFASFKEFEKNKKETPSFKVIISEIAWAGTKASPHDEWIELYNTTNSTIDLTGWRLFAQDGTPNILLEGKILPQSYFLLERTDDETISDLKADQIYKGALSNEGEILYLEDSEGNLVDLVKADSGWPGGKSQERVSMERKDLQNWQDNNKIIKNGFDAKQNPIFGTPKAPNSPSKGPLLLPHEIFGNVTFSQKFSPYLVNQDVIFMPNSHVTIEPGVVFKFYPQENAFFDIYGTFEAKGTPEEPILFTSLRDDSDGNNNRRKEDYDQKGNPILPKPGDWRHLYFRPESEGNFENVIFRYGGTKKEREAVLIVEKSAFFKIKNSLFEKNRSCLWLKNSQAFVEKTKFLENKSSPIKIEGASPEIKNCFFKKNQGEKIISVSGKATPLIENNEFQENSGIPIYLAPCSLGKISGNFGQNNSLNGIEIGGSCFEFQEGFLLSFFPNPDFPYVRKGDLEIPAFATLEIKEGAMVKFLGGALKIKGNLENKATSQNPAIFTSLYDDQNGKDTNNDGSQTQPQKGDWKGIEIEQGKANLENIKILYAF